jgi:1-phosphofructokinase
MTTPPLNQPGDAPGRDSVIITVTPNPGLDLTYVLAHGTGADIDVHRARSATLEASGKGVNISRTLWAANVETCAVLPVAGATGRYLVELLDDDGIPHRQVTQDGSTRVNTSALQPGGVTLKLNGPGSPLSSKQQDELVDQVAAALDDGITSSGTRTPQIWLAVCGSLPPKADPGLMARLVAVAHDRGARCAVDASGEALAAALDAQADLLAPNLGELAEASPLIRDATQGIKGIAEAAAALSHERGIELLVSLGNDGALWSNGLRTLHATGPTIIPVNTAGAGDALLAGWLAHEDEPDVRLGRAVLWGRSACLTPTTVDPVPGAGDPGPVTVHDLSVTRSL